MFIGDVETDITTRKGHDAAAERNKKIGLPVLVIEPDGHIHVIACGLADITGTEGIDRCAGGVVIRRGRIGVYRTDGFTGSITDGVDRIGEARIVDAQRMSLALHFAIARMSRPIEVAVSGTEFPFQGDQSTIGFRCSPLLLVLLQIGECFRQKQRCPYAKAWTRRRQSCDVLSRQESIVVEKCYRASARGSIVQNGLALVGDDFGADSLGVSQFRRDCYRIGQIIMANDIGTQAFHTCIETIEITEPISVPSCRERNTQNRAWIIGRQSAGR